MKTIYELVDRETAEVRSTNTAPEMPHQLSMMGCGRHQMYQDGVNLRCALCSTHVYPGGLLYEATRRWFEATQVQIRRSA